MELFKKFVELAATLVGTSIMLPQVYKSMKTKCMSDIAWGMLVLYFLNSILWLTYGILIGSLPLMAANGIALGISILQIALKVKYGK